MGYTARITLSIIIAFAVTVFLSRVLIPILKNKKAEQHVRDDGPQSHLVKEGTPTMGGIMIILGIVAATVAFSLYNLQSAPVMLYLLIATLLFAIIGFLDDSIKLFKKRSLGLRAWQKIVLQFIFAAAVACFSYFVLGNSSETIPFSHAQWNIGAGQIPFTMFVFIAMVNSVNLTDGLDGLATSLSLINGIAFLAIIMSILTGGVILGSADSVAGDTVNIGIFTAALIGACIGFLIFNRHPAKVFMGDTGSFTLGAALTAIASALGIQLILPIIGLMFVLSSVSVIIQVGSFKLRHKRVFRMAPLHHHFELGGATETKVVLGYVIVTALLSIIGVLGYMNM